MPAGVRAEHLEILINGCKVDDREKLRALLLAIEKEPSRKIELASHNGALAHAVADPREQLHPHPLTGLSLSTLDKPEIATPIKNALKSEAALMLKTTNIFDSRGYRALQKSVLVNPSFKAIAGKTTCLTSVIDSALCYSDRLGIEDEEVAIKSLLCSGPPIHVALSGTMIASLSIFEYLRWKKGYQIECSYRHLTSLDILHRISKGGFSREPDLCLFGLPPAASLMATCAKIPYKPFMIMPKVSNRIVAPQSTKEKPLPERRHYVFSGASPTSAVFCFDALKRRSQIDERRVLVEHMDPGEIAAALSSDDPDLCAIIWFPHYEMNRILNGCRVLEHFGQEDSDLVTVLFAHENFLKNRKRAQALDIAVRDAWLDLIEDGQAVASIIDTIFSDTQYKKFLYRCCGLYNMSCRSLVSDSESPPLSSVLDRSGAQSVWR